MSEQIHRVIIRALLSVLCGVLLLAARASPVCAGAPARTPTPVPGYHINARFEDQWVAPFVQYSWTSVAGRVSYLVRRYSDNGAVVSETDEQFSLMSPFGFFFVSGPFENQTFHGMYGDWQLESRGKAVNVLACVNGRSMVRLVGDNDRGPANKVEVYVLGRHTADLSVGPNERLASFQMGSDGSVAVLFASKPAGSTEALVTNAAGELRMRFVAPGTSHIRPGEDGQGALLWQTDGVVTYVDSDGARHEVRPPTPLASWFGHWVPGTRLALLGNEKERTHVLVDFARQRVRWQVEAPSHLAELFAVPFENYVFQSGLESVPTPERPEGSVRIIRAIDIDSGELVATWRSWPTANYTWRDVGKLIVRDGRLFYVTDDEFSEIRPEDVAEASGGCGGCWEPSAAGD